MRISHTNHFNQSNPKILTSNFSINLISESDDDLRCNRNLIWSPFYCVLQQEEQTFTAYCSEELSIIPVTPNREIRLADVFFAELPRIRLDGRSSESRPRTRKAIWEPSPSTIHEEAEDEMVFNSSNIELNTALQGCLANLQQTIKTSTVAKRPLIININP
ncbi:unnamed protein product [Chironomus riparius]|uniref:Uncharacterized protein n=1 Tax=Chironomus riparius TaxID=315576 RepID=A0A9N9WXD0_9DIPT|nr:unnamed protein product [Chironomus riparius]